jgi:uncharacterized membrane protein
MSIFKSSKKQNVEQTTEKSKTLEKVSDKIEQEQKAQKKVETKETKVTKIAFNIIAIFCIVIFAFALTPKTFQNDTYYTIKIGQDIRANGIDYVDHYSWHENLDYTYPHWLYDFITGLIYDFCGGFAGIYAATVILAMTMGILLYVTNKKLSKNEVLSFVMTMAQLYMLRAYICARAQLVTFSLFILTVLIIECFLEKPKWWHGALLVAISLLIANLHLATWPFYFVLYLPFIGEYIVSVLFEGKLFHWIAIKIANIRLKRASRKLKKAPEGSKAVEKYKGLIVRCNNDITAENEHFEKFKVKYAEKLKTPYKVKMEKLKHVPKLFIIIAIAILMGFCTPLKDAPFTYTLLTAKGTTMQGISEHLPLTLAQNLDMIICLVAILSMLIFTKVKIKLRDLFFVIGLGTLAFATRRQVSMFVIFVGFVATKMFASLMETYLKDLKVKLMNFVTTVLGTILVVVFVLAISFLNYHPIINDPFVGSAYPIDACEWIKNNIEDYNDTSKVKFFNDYNYGSYILFQGIPVFIDSRADLYTPEFNGEYNANTHKYTGNDVFQDYLNISGIGVYYKDSFRTYGITHVLVKSNSKLSMLLSHDKDYAEEIHPKDAQGFVIYKLKDASK